MAGMKVKLWCDDFEGLCDFHEYLIIAQPHVSTDVTPVFEIEIENPVDFIRKAVKKVFKHRYDWRPIFRRALRQFYSGAPAKILTWELDEVYHEENGKRGLNEKILQNLLNKNIF